MQLRQRYVTERGHYVTMHNVRVAFEGLPCDIGPGVIVEPLLQVIADGHTDRLYIGASIEFMEQASEFALCIPLSATDRRPFLLALAVRATSEIQNDSRR